MTPNAADSARAHLKREKASLPQNGMLHRLTSNPATLKPQPPMQRSLAIIRYGYPCVWLKLRAKEHTLCRVAPTK
jgi:hypothetical protein